MAPAPVRFPLAVAVAARHVLFAPHRQQSQDAAARASQTELYLALGAVLGVAYSLGTEKFMRAMRHRHIFVRNAMLWLSAAAWLFAAAAAAWVTTLIYNQSGGGLEGFDRVLGVLIPFVVRADLVVDWAKRVSWALLNMVTWTQASVQLRRLLARAKSMDTVVSVDEEVESIAFAHHSPQSDITISSEDRVWNEDTDSLVRLADVLHHFAKLGRIAIYALGGLLFALPGTVVWIVYAAYYGVVSFHDSQHVLGCLYLLSIILAPVGCVILLIASALLLCGVVSLSIVGTIIQFSVYWSTRTVYSMVRIALSQAWAGYPGITNPNAMPTVQRGPLAPNAGPFAVNAVRQPEEAGTAIAQVGSLLPTELEFTLASWDGFHQGDMVKPAWFSRKFFSFVLPKKTEPDSEPEARDRASKPPLNQERGQKLNHQRESNEHSTKARQKRGSSVEGTDGVLRLDGEDGSSQAYICADSTVNGDALEGTRDGRGGNETVLVLLGRLGMDLSVKSVRKRRLSTYYAFGMLAHLQVESGGSAWRLHAIEDIHEHEFEERIQRFNCIIADEAKIALQELGTRLRGTSKYRVIPTGAPNNQMVSVNSWLRLALLAFLESPAESDGCKRPQSLGTT